MPGKVSSGLGKEVVDWKHPPLLKVRNAPTKQEQYFEHIYFIPQNDQHRHPLPSPSWAKCVIVLAARCV